MKHALLAFAATLALSTVAHAATLNDALNAYRENRVAEAERLHREIAADPNASAADRAGALRELARIDWLLRGETDAMGTALERTAAPERCATAALALRVYREGEAPATPLAAAEAGRADCTPGAAETLRVELARTHLALAIATPAERDAQLAQAEAELAAIDSIASGAPDVAGARFSVAMARRDAAAAFDAWRAYYWLNDADAPQAMSPYAGRVRATFEAGLAARAGDDPTWRRAALFFTFEQTVRDATLRANRAMIAGGRVPRYGDEIRDAMGQLMQGAGLSGDPRVVLPTEFGVYGTLGETSGYPSLHGGHMVEDRTIVADQYGHRGELRFVVIDNMLANGFESWLWDGSAEAGGWAGDDVIVQVRSAYTGGPLGALRRTRPGPTRDRFLAGLVSVEASERAALGRNGVAVLPATGERLELQAYDQIAQRVGADDAAFIAEVWRATNQYSIEMHEGRHAIDNARGNFSAAELEFMAKLSQIALADYPRLGLASVATQAQGDTPHGAANRRVLTGYRDWMRRHAAEIPGFNRDASSLTQLTLLSDAQIVTIAQSMDRLAQTRR